MAGKKHQRFNFQCGGLYALGTPESNYFRPLYLHKPRGVKVGKSKNLRRRLNEYTLYCPWAVPALTVHCLLLMPYETKQDKQRIEAAETWVLSTLKKREESGSGRSTVAGGTAGGGGNAFHQRPGPTFGGWLCGNPRLHTNPLGALWDRLVPRTTQFNLHSICSQANRAAGPVLRPSTYYFSPAEHYVCSAYFFH